MRRLTVVSWIVASAAGLDAATLAADSTRGAQLFQTLQCVGCHSINGVGGKVGPDLGRRVDRGFTPATLAATLWNHAPAMWSAMKERQIQAGNLDEQAAMDLFAYFYSAHFFDRLGDAGRGKQAFTADHCAKCHSVTEPSHGADEPIVPLPAVNEPIALVNAMWNHAATMREQFAKRKLNWPELSSQDLTDMLVYLRNIPAARNAATRVEITAGSQGEALFASKGCAGCHANAATLALKLKGQTLTDIAVDMWNHAPKMGPAAPKLGLDEMREIVSYIWAAQFFEDSGNASAGEHVFTAKHCAGCHNDPSSGAPKLTGRTFTGATMVSALWHHGPQMLDQMRTKGIAWPRFEGQEMANLIAYLNSASRTK